jgi:phosphoenolpyruvate carboxykinase (GTP)
MPSASAPTAHHRLSQWVDEVAQLTQPAAVVWCDGSEQERLALTDLLVQTGEFTPLNPSTHPQSYWYKSDPQDVARTEHLTFVCTEAQADAGPNNVWMAPAAAKAKMADLFKGCMRQRTMYVIPYCMGPLGSPLARYGVEITDSAYVVLNMRLMTRMGNGALQYINQSGEFVRGLHSIGELDPKRRFIMHFPEEHLIQSFGSGYGGNALLGKKCHALRIASFQGRQEGWLAEHMLLLSLTSPSGEQHYVAAAFPSACGKTNLAMLLPPESMPGWTITTIGDDIAWLQPGADGRLWAINPEAGYFGVAPGTTPKTNRNAYEMIKTNTIFTNVALTEDAQPWWEGLPGKPATNWQGNAIAEAGPHAHPNARFTVSARQNPSFAPESDDPKGVPLSAIIFGGRRRSLAPLVYQARDWEHGVLVGASIASETTAAITGQVGVLRRDPMAMKPFCGYHFGDYWQHWLNIGKQLSRPPQIFHVNWFRQQADGKFLWPGFSDNLRVLEWIIKRIEKRIDAKTTPIGFMPNPHDLNRDGLNLSDDTLQQLLTVDPQEWLQELAALQEDFKPYMDRFPPALAAQVDQLRQRLTQ